MFDVILLQGKILYVLFGGTFFLGLASFGNISNSILRDSAVKNGGGVGDRKFSYVVGRLERWKKKKLSGSDDSLFSFFSSQHFFARRKKEDPFSKGYAVESIFYLAQKSCADVEHDCLIWQKGGK